MDAEGEAALVDWLIRARLAAEVAALPVLDGLSPGSRLRLDLERECTRALAVARARTLARCDEALRGAGVRATTLKGEAVIALTHGDASRRPMADLDLLVLPEDRAAAGRALEGAGMLRPGADTALHDVFLDPRESGTGRGRGTAIEVHDDVFPRPHPFALPVRRAVERGAPGPGIHPPSREDAIVLCALSFAFHETDGAKTWACLRDLALLAATLDGSSARASLADAAGTGSLAAAVAGALELARVAGAPAMAGEGLAAARPETWRRRLATRLALAEAAAGLEGGGPGQPRRLTRRLAAALWEPSRLATLRALARAAVSPAGEGAGARWRRLGRGLGSLRWRR